MLRYIDIYLTKEEGSFVHLCDVPGVIVRTKFIKTN